MNCMATWTPINNYYEYFLTKGIIPKEWKEAKVIEIHLNFILLLFERAVYNQPNEYLTEHQILCKHQSGFRQNHSTITSIVYVTDFIYKNMDYSLLTGIAYVDLQKAFDTVDHSVLLRK